MGSQLGLIICADASFVDWLFEEAAKGAPDAAPPVAEASTSVQRRESPPHLAETARKPPSGPRAGAPLYQQAISQAIPSTSPTGQKRTASARSPSPSGHVNKSRRLDGPPTGPRAMQHGSGNGGSRSLLERMGAPSRNGHAPYGQDDIQTRIDHITNGSPDANMMMMGGGFPMGGMPGMDMAMTNPMVLQEMMMNQMALMTQMAGAMGIMNGGFPMQGMGGDMGMFNGGMNGMQGPMGGGMDGRGRGRGRGGSRGTGRGGRGGQHNQNAGPHSADGPMNGAPQAAQPPPIAPAPAIVAPTPVPAPVAAPAPPITPSTSSSSQTRPAFIPPERPQSPTLCKFSLKCTNPLCRYSHPSPVATPESGVVLSNEACEKGKDCKDKDCIKAHVSPAVLNPSGTRHITVQKSSLLTLACSRISETQHILLFCSSRYASAHDISNTLSVWCRLYAPQLFVFSSSPRTPQRCLYTLQVWHSVHTRELPIPAPRRPCPSILVPSWSLYFRLGGESPHSADGLNGRVQP